MIERAKQQRAVVGYAHMQYLNNDIPQDLDCCAPLEYPVETALGTVDFLTEDVHGGESAIQAYYRLLNCGFRPGLAAATDFPCNCHEPIGTQLTYVRTADGKLTYRGWIDGIARGRTVVSRNAHREFPELKVNAKAAPGVESRFGAKERSRWTLAGRRQCPHWAHRARPQRRCRRLPRGVRRARLASDTRTPPLLHRKRLDLRRERCIRPPVAHQRYLRVPERRTPVRASSADADFFVASSTT